MLLTGLITAVAVLPLSGVLAASTPKAVTCPDGKNKAINAACCSLFAIRDDIQENLFDGSQCNSAVQESLRLVFHDAIGIGSNGGGGADGSIVTFATTEMKFAANAGVQDIVSELAPLVAKHGISSGDLIPFAAAVGLTNCPGAPQLNFFLGRPNAKIAAPDLTVPEPFDTIDTILARFADAGNFTAAEVVALVGGAHSLGSQNLVDHTIPGAPFDSTPGVFDTQIFVEVQLRGTLFPGTGGNQGEAESPLKGELRLLSDSNLARDSRTSCAWQGFVGNEAGLQSSFKSAFEKLSFLGQNTKKLVDCSDVIPQPSTKKIKAAHFPAGLTHTNVEQACATAAFPTLVTDPGPATSVAPFQS